MATINFVILPAKKLADNRHKVRVSVAHNGETKYIVTDIIVDKLSQLHNGKVVGHEKASYYNSKIRKLDALYNQIIDDTEFIDAMSCGEVVELLKTGKSKQSYTFDDAYRHMIKLSKAKPSTLRQYDSIWKNICTIIDKDTKLNSLSNVTIQKLETGLIKKGCALTTIRVCMAFFKSVIKHASDFEMVALKKNYWVNIKLPQSEIRESWITLEELKKVRDYQTKFKKRVFWRDIFMLSFYLGGMNMVDILSIDWHKVFKSGKIEYVRSKSISYKRKQSKVEFFIPSEANTLLESLLKNEHFRSLNHESFENSKRTCLRQSIKRIGEDIGCDKLIFYSARKTFSQIAFELGIQSYVIDYILGHSIRKSGSCLYHYVYVTPQMATDAIRKVLDFIK